MPAITYKLFVTILPAFLLMLTACNRQDTKHLAKVGEIVQSRGKETLEDIHAQHLSEFSINSVMTSSLIAGRVRSRLQLDQALQKTEIEVIPNGEEVELKGKVNTLAQRQRAVDLAKTTLGVNGVIDKITVEE